MQTAPIAVASVARDTALLSYPVRVIAAGAAYAAARAVALGIAIIFGASAPSEPLTWFALEMAAGIVIALALALVAQMLAGSMQRRLFAIAMLIFVSILAVLIEGAAFQPAAVPFPTLPLGALLQAGVAIATAVAIVRLFATLSVPTQLADVPRRTRRSWSWRYSVSALTYVAL
jgi:hypothetical protein